MAAVRLGRNFHLKQVFQGLIDGFEIALNNGLTPLPVGLLDRMLDFSDGLIVGQNAADCKKTGLHDRVDPSAHVGLFSNFVGIDDIETQLLLNDCFLGFFRQIDPKLAQDRRC